MKNYLDLLHYVNTEGTAKEDRTGVGTRSCFGYPLRFDLGAGFPLVTTKKIHLKSVVHELLWFLAGDTNTAYLREHGVRIWDEWADERGDLGPIYGAQWRSWQGADGAMVDQIGNAVHLLKTDPNSRRIIVSAWNAALIPQMALAPCHALFQFYVAENKLSCLLYQRSADMFLGVPFNIASYALLTHMMAQQTGLVAHEFIWVGGDCHVYTNHQAQVAQQLSRTPKALPRLVIKRQPQDIFSYQFDDFEFQDYEPWPAIKAPVAV